VIHQPDGEHEFTLEAFDAMLRFFEFSLGGRKEGGA
jgi:hypothetical protein